MKSEQENRPKLVLKTITGADGYRWQPSKEPMSAEEMVALAFEEGNRRIREKKREVLK